MIGRRGFIGTIARGDHKLEAGRYDPTVGVLQRLAKALGVPVTELLK
jgi:transcriptional regulator with XRE-family HTH domain